jgi:hypothetical protein
MYPHRPDPATGETLVDETTGQPRVIRSTEIIVEAADGTGYLAWTCQEFLGRGENVPLASRTSRIVHSKPVTLMCSRCRQSLPVKAFGKADNARGRRYWCKACANTAHNARYQRRRNSCTKT